MVGLVGLVGEGVTEEEMVDLGRGRGRGLGVGIFANNPKKEKKKSYIWRLSLQYGRTNFDRSVAFLRAQNVEMEIEGRTRSVVSTVSDCL